MSTSTAALVASVAAATNTTHNHNHHRHRHPRKNRSTCLLSICLSNPGSPSQHSVRFLSQVEKDSKRRNEQQSSAADGGGNGSTTSIGHEELEEADKIVDGMDFGELCDEFECISSPSVEATARQLARDILELRAGNRALGIYAISVKYKDPVRTFTGREKYKRPMWVTDALDKPTVSVQEMKMLSTSVLRIKWTIRGRPKSSLGGIIGGDLIVKVTSEFTLNQISGQVIEHKEFWDLSASSTLSQAFFWSSRRIFATIEGGKDLSDSVKNIRSRFSTQKENVEIYPDPSDPTKFFQSDDGFQRDAYQLALFVAILYFVVQFLKITL